MFDATLKKYLETRQHNPPGINLHPPSSQLMSPVTPNPSPSLPHAPNAQNDGITHEVFYRSQFSASYKTDERIIKTIVANNTSCIDPSDNLKLIVYYKSAKIPAIVTKNNQSPPAPLLQQSDLVYEYTCKRDGCERLQNSYIGVTTTTLSRRLTMHLQQGSIKIHHNSVHRQPPTREDLVANTRVLCRENNVPRLHKMEAFHILLGRPSLNYQATGIDRVLKLFG